MGAQPIRHAGLPLRPGGAVGDRGRALTGKTGKKKIIAQGIRLSKRS